MTVHHRIVNNAWNRLATECRERFNCELDATTRRLFLNDVENLIDEFVTDMLNGLEEYYKELNASETKETN